GTIIGFVLGGIMIYFVGLTYAELTPAMPKAGGEHVFSYRAFGPVGSFACTWMLVLSYIGVVCFEAVSLPAIIQYIFPGAAKGYLYTVAGSDVYATGLLISSLFAIGITAMNVMGIKVASFFQTMMTLVIALVGIVLVVASGINGSPANLNEHLFCPSGANPIKSILSVATVAPFFLFGFDVIPQVAEEIRMPLGKIARVLLLSIVCAVSFYGFVVWAVGYAMSSGEISLAMQKSGGLVTAAAMEKVFNSTIMAKVLIIGGLCGIVTSWNSFLIGGSRSIYAMANSKMIPGRFSMIGEKYKTPHNAIFLVSGLSIIAPFFGKTMLVWIANAASFACCFAYFMVAASFLMLRKKEPDMERPYKIKHHRFVGCMATVLSMIMVALYLIPGTGATLSLQEFAIVGGGILLGITFFGICKRHYKDRFGIER
ncbi:MAG: APC family permease, partial [Victivallales bacterium]|nr:APC family permease [Victivallales bacterium]